LRRYGVSDGSTALLVIRIDPLEDLDVKSRMSAVINGDLAPISELADLTDWSAVKKVGGSTIPRVHSFMWGQYNKLNGDLFIKERQNDPAHEHHLIDNIVVSLVAMKSVAA
jgi:EKC/KEOPS complex subunit CGI121/TPRKB